MEQIQTEKQQPRYVLVTVGTSAITNEDIGRGGAADKDNQELRNRVKQYLTQEEPDKAPEKNATLLVDLVQAHREFWETPELIHNSDYRLQTSAELVSTDLLLRDSSDTLITSYIVLLHSATNEGRFAATLNLQILDIFFKPETVLKFEIKGLDEQLVDVDARLGETVAKLPFSLPAEDTWINFTGGYKGVIPALTGLAQKHNWKMFCLHEKGNSPISVKTSATAIITEPIKPKKMGLPGLRS